LVGAPAAPQETGALLPILAAMAAQGGAIRLAVRARIARSLRPFCRSLLSVLYEKHFPPVKILVQIT
jgi:hypothetical protein